MQSAALVGRKTVVVDNIILLSYVQHRNNVADCGGPKFPTIFAQGCFFRSDTVWKLSVAHKITREYGTHTMSHSYNVY